MNPYSGRQAFINALRVAKERQGKTRKRKTKPIDTSGVDWSRPAKELAEELACSEMSIYRLRRKAKEQAR